MAHLAVTESTGSVVIHTPLGNTTPVVQVDIGCILHQARLSSASITQIVENYTQTMSRSVDADTLSFLNSMADSALYSHQVNLQLLQQLLPTTYGPQPFAKISVFKNDNFVLPIFLLPKLRSVAQIE